MNDAMGLVLKRLHYPIDAMLVCVRWYAAYPLSLRNLKEMMAERGVVVGRTTVSCRTVLPVLSLMLRWRKRAVDKTGQTIDFFLRAHRDHACCARPVPGTPRLRAACGRSRASSTHPLHSRTPVP